MAAQMLFLFIKQIVFTVRQIDGDHAFLIIVIGSLGVDFFLILILVDEFKHVVIGVSVDFQRVEHRELIRRLTDERESGKQVTQTILTNAYTHGIHTCIEILNTFNTPKSPPMPHPS